MDTYPVQSLPFQLPDPTPFPGRIALEEAVPCSEPFDSPDWRFSVDWDGARALLFADQDGGVGLQAANLADLTPRFPELAGAGRVILRRPAVLDGVVAVLDPSGRPDLASLGSRLVAPLERAGRAPAVFLATDVLHVAGVPVLRWPLDRRLQTLASIVESDSAVQVPDHVGGRGGPLAEAARERGLSALLARRASAPYRPGVASPDRLRIELQPRACCVVAGVEVTRHSRVGRLVLGEQLAGRLVFAGHVDGPRDPAVDRWLHARVEALAAGAPALDGATGRGQATWLRPVLCASVGYTRRGSDGLLQGTTLLAVRDDADPAWCVRRDAQAPPTHTTGAGFMPTVLMPLPLGETLLLPRQRS